MRVIRTHEAPNVSGYDVDASALAGGAPGVTTTGTQTLTNKTLTSPVLGGTITGTYTLDGTPTIDGVAITGTSTIANGMTITTPVLSGSVTGTYTLAGTPTITAPAISACAITGTSTIGNGMTITTPVLSGSITGTYTLAGTPTITSPTITGAGMTTTTFTSGTLGGDLVDAGIKRCTADTTAATDVVLGDITGLTGFTLTASGTYAFEVDLQTSMSVNGGIAVSFNYTTATLTSIQLGGIISAVAGAISIARNTTTTTQTLFVNTKAAVYLNVKLSGTMVVSTGGTLAVQMCQETSHADTTTVFAGSTARFTRIA